MDSTTKFVLGFLLAAVGAAGEYKLVSVARVSKCWVSTVQVSQESSLLYISGGPALNRDLYDHMYTTIARRDFAVISCSARA